jgi:hypothetical protein
MRSARPVIQTLHKLKAIGPEFAAVLVGEIFHRDFNKALLIPWSCATFPLWNGLGAKPT